MSKVKKAVIPAAGLGIRFLPATKAIPKEMLPIVDKPALQYVVEEMAEAGIEDLLIVTSRNKNPIEDHFDKSPELEMALEKKGREDLLNVVKKISTMMNVYYVRQVEPKGLGDAIRYAKSFTGKDPFAVILGDDIVDSKVPCIKQLMEVYDQVDSEVIGVQKVCKKDLNKYGIIDGVLLEENIYKVKDMVEKPKIEDAPSNVAILGRYILTSDIFAILDQQEAGVGEEVQLTDSLKILATKKDVYAYNFQGKRYDVGDKLGYLKATVEFALKRGDLSLPFRDYLNELINK